MLTEAQHKFARKARYCDASTAVPNPPDMSHDSA
jgi:hypothetical protein